MTDPKPPADTSWVKTTEDDDDRYLRRSMWVPMRWCLILSAVVILVSIVLDWMGA